MKKWNHNNDIQNKKRSKADKHVTVRISFKYFYRIIYYKREIKQNLVRRIPALFCWQSVTIYINYNLDTTWVCYILVYRLFFFFVYLLISSYFWKVILDIGFIWWFFLTQCIVGEARKRRQKISRVYRSHAELIKRIMND